MAVFSSKQEAGEFFRHRLPGGEWCIRELPAREDSFEFDALLGDYGRVALDPPPEVEDRSVDGLVTVSRREFEEMLGREDHLCHSFSGLARPKAIPGGEL